MADLNLKLATGNYGHTMPLKDGTVTSERVSFELVDVPIIINAFRRMIRDLEFDVSEMAISTYLCARAHDVPITALPVFLVRAFHHGSISYNVKSGIKSPNDLEGRRVGVRAYTVTTGVWNRGILANQYGVDLNKVTWVINSDEHVAQYQEPANVESVSPDLNLGDMLKSGDIDAAIGVPPSPDDGIERLIPDAQDAAVASLKSSGVYPINHTLVVRNEHLAANPWLAAELFSMFKNSKESFLAGLDAMEDPKGEDANSKKMKGILGGDPLPYGVEANRKTLEAIIQHVVDQKVIPAKVSVDEVFEPSTLALLG
jgi:4,5-dihydroxyphthalate decarboxylase